MYLSKLQNVFVQIEKLYFKIYLTRSPLSLRSLLSSSASWRRNPSLGRTSRCFRTWDTTMGVVMIVWQIPIYIVPVPDINQLIWWKRTQNASENETRLNKSLHSSHTVSEHQVGQYLTHVNDEVRKKSKERVFQMTWWGNVLGDVGYSKRMGKRKY